MNMKDNSFISKIFTEKYLKRINKKNMLFGLKYNYDINKLLTYHLINVVIILVFMMITMRSYFLYSPLVCIIYFYGTEYLFFDLRLKKRENILGQESIFFFQILLLTIESGNNLKNAIEITSNNINSNLSREFHKVIDDMNLGKNLPEALDDLKLRIPNDIINNIILGLTQSHIYGGNMIESLRNQIDYLNDKLLLETKARINKMPVKISIVSVLIFIPLILLIIVGPLLLEIFGV